MSAKFGRKDEEKQEKIEQWRLVLRAAYERLDRLPLIDLAAEVMNRGFGPGGPGADDDKITVGQQNINAGPTAERISFEFAPERGFTFPLPTPEDFELRARIAKLVNDGLQELERGEVRRILDYMPGALREPPSGFRTSSGT